MSALKNSSPLPIRLVRRFCPEHLPEEIEGDLIQRFEKDVWRVEILLTLDS
jgi:hypothetical protein